MTTIDISRAVPVAPERGTLRPLSLDEARITGGFWGDRQELNRSATLGHILSRLESEGWLPNFDLAAAGSLPAGRRGEQFSDSEVYKYLEAVAWELGRRDDAELEQTFRSVVRRIAAAQEADGYLQTKFGRPGQVGRWEDLKFGHELYCFGHLFQAAIARHRTRPGADDGLVGIAVRLADLVCDVFGDGGIESVCGHAEIEVGMAELGRALDEPRYVEQARLFIDRRGAQTLPDIEWGRQYFQDDIPLREASVGRGHVVRANYLAAGAVDVAVATDDDELLDALTLQWRNNVARRTYITGGQGSRHQDEAFGEDFELPSDRSYSETCAGIASIMYSWRLMLRSGGAQYADLIERTLYNVLATSTGTDGTSFYYQNTLHQRVPGVVPDPDSTSLRARSSLRAPWFQISCCPPNIARTLASLDAYVATADDEGLQLHQYAPSELRVTLADGREAHVDVATDYPHDGRIAVTAVVDAVAPWTLSLRVPNWAAGASLRVVSADGIVEEREVDPGVAEVRRAFRAGDRVELDLPVRPRFTFPDPRIDAIRGCVAVERGPLVLALEVPAGGIDIATLAVDADAPLVERDGVVSASLIAQSAADDAWPYGGAENATTASSTQTPLVAYHAWANDGPSTMRIWIPRA